MQPRPSHHAVSHVESADRLFGKLRVHVTELDFPEEAKVALCRLRGPTQRPRGRSIMAGR